MIRDDGALCVCRIAKQKNKKTIEAVRARALITQRVFLSQATGPGALRVRLGKRALEYHTTVDAQGSALTDDLKPGNELADSTRGIGGIAANPPLQGPGR